MLDIGHRTVSLADQVFERLEKEILLGNYRRGEILTETKLAEDLGVSRTPIREAIRRLEVESIVEITAKGIVVLGVTKSDLEDIYAVRVRIEGMAAKFAAEKITDEELGELKETVDLQQYYVSLQDAERIKFYDSRFHQLLYKFSKSRVLYDTLSTLHVKTQKFRRTSVEDHSRAELSVKEHKAVFDAVAAHNAEAAETAMVNHIENAMQHILEGVEE